MATVKVVGLCFLLGSAAAQQSYRAPSNSYSASTPGFSGNGNQFSGSSSSSFGTSNQFSGSQSSTSFGDYDYTDSFSSPGFDQEYQSPDAFGTPSPTSFNRGNDVFATATLPSGGQSSFVDSGSHSTNSGFESSQPFSGSSNNNFAPSGSFTSSSSGVDNTNFLAPVPSDFGAPASTSNNFAGIDIRTSSSGRNRGQTGGTSGGRTGGRPGGASGGSSPSGGNRGQAPEGIDFSQAERLPDGRLCVIKYDEVETLAKDPLLECTHKNVEKCHYTYVTKFKSAQEEICDENFEKLCQITFKQQAVKEKVKKCYRPQKKVCDGRGPEVCNTVYETSCTTKYIPKPNGKFVGDTQCEKLPVEVCGAGCVTEEGPEECHEKEVDALVDVPEESCDLNPQKTCRFVTKLVPTLHPVPECTIVPREVCNLKFTSPRKEKKPLRSEWCLDESAPEPDSDRYEAAASEQVLSVYGV